MIFPISRLSQRRSGAIARTSVVASAVPSPRWLIVVIFCGAVVAATPSVSHGQACYSVDHKVQVGVTGNPCTKSGVVNFGQSGLQESWYWANAEDDEDTHFSCGASGIVTSCSVSMDSSFDGSGSITVTYSTGTTGSSGTVTVTARDAGSTGEHATGTLSVSTVTISTAFTNATDQSLARCAQGCFAARVQASTPAYYSLNLPRAVTLVYDGDRVRARPFVYADVAANGSSPNNYQLQVTTSAGAKIGFTNGDSILTFASGASGRLSGQLALDSTIASSPFAVTVTVISNYPSSSGSQSTPFKLAVANERNSPIAHGWTLSGIQHLYAQSSDSAIMITEGDGSAEIWTACTSGGCTGTPAGEYSALSYSGGFPATTYLRSYPDSTKVTFNSLGEMIKITDPFGNNDSLAYDTQGRLTAIYDPIRMNGSSRAYISLTYGSTYGIASIASPGPTGSFTGGRTTTYRVNASDSTLAAVYDPDGDSTVFGYDSRKRLSWVRDRRGDTTKYGYDNRSFKLTSTTTPPIPVDNGNGTTTTKTLTTTYSPWQIVGVDTLPTSPSSPAPLGTESPAGVVIDSKHDTTSFTVNRWGQALVVTNALHAQQTVSIADSNPVPQTVTTFQGGTAHYTWTASKPTSYQPPGGQTTTIQYNSGYSVPDSVTSPGQPAQRRFIGTGGRVDSVRFASSSSRMARFTYDSRGRMLQQTDIHGHVTKYHYETVFGNTDSIQAPGNRVTVMRFDGFGRDSLLWHNSTAKATTVYDLLNRVTAVYDGVDANPVQTTYDGLFVTRLQDPKGQIHKYDVDALGRIVNDYDMGDTTKFQSFRYDSGGSLTGITNRRGQTTQFTYDRLLRELSSVRSVSGTVVTADSFAYDIYGLLSVRWNMRARDSIFVDANGWTDSVVTHIPDPGKRYRIQYVPDSLMRLKSELITNDNGVQPLPRYYTYDSTSGNVASIALSTGTGLKTTFTYNTEFNLIGIAYPGTGTGIGQPGPYGDSLTSIHSAYKTQFTNSVLDNPYNYKAGFDSLGRVNTIIPVNINDNNWDNFQFFYDGMGRLLAAHNQESTTLCPADTTYGYQCGSLTAKDTLIYDAASNLVGGTVQGVAAAGGYRYGNRDTTLRGVSHTFDFDGNVTSSGSRQLFWGVEGHLDSVVAGSDTLRYGYDAGGRLVKRWRNGTLERILIWDGSQLLAEFDSTGTQRIGEYVSTGTDQPFAFVSGATSLQAVSYFIMDPLGSVLGLVKSDSTGLQVMREQYWYDDFGTPFANVDSGYANRMRWKSMLYEGDSTRLYYVRARWYDPQQGRFMSEDPAGAAGGPNQYVFAQNDYINGFDPSGALCLFTTFDTGYTCSGGSGYDDTPWGVGPLDPELADFEVSSYLMGQTTQCVSASTSPQCQQIYDAITGLQASNDPRCGTAGAVASLLFAQQDIFTVDFYPGALTRFDAQRYQNQNYGGGGVILGQEDYPNPGQFSLTNAAFLPGPGDDVSGVVAHETWHILGFQHSNAPLAPDNPYWAADTVGHVCSNLQP